MILSPEQFDQILLKKDFEERIDELAVKMASKEDVARILDAVEGIATEHKRFDQELAANIGAHDRFEARISKLESAS